MVIHRDPPRPQEVCEFGRYRFTVNYPLRWPNGDRPLDPEIEARLQAHHDAHLTNPADTPARKGWNALPPPARYDPKGDAHRTGNCRSFGCVCNRAPAAPV